MPTGGETYVNFEMPTRIVHAGAAPGGGYFPMYDGVALQTSPVTAATIRNMSGGVTGPGPTAVDNELARMNGTGGYAIQGGGPVVDDSGNMVLAGTLELAGDLKIGGVDRYIKDSNGNTALRILANATLNEDYLTITSEETGTPPKISAAGAGANVGINLKPKGTGEVQVSGSRVMDHGQYNASTVMAADTDNTPLPVTVNASTVVGRKSTGGISAITADELLAILNGGATTLVTALIAAKFRTQAVPYVCGSADNPIANNDDFPCAAIPFAATITKIGHYCTGTATPTVTWNIVKRAHNSDTGGTDVFTADKVAGATGADITTFDAASITAEDKLVVECRGTSGTPYALHLYIEWEIS